MHRRARHLSGRAAGADLFFDARRIQGLSDGTGVQTWEDLSVNANNATQATSGKRPLYKVNIQGGCPMLLYDNSDDSLQCGAASGLTSAYSIVAVGRRNSASSGSDNLMYYGNYNVYSPNFNWVGIESYGSNFGLGNYNNPTIGSVNSAADTNYNVFSGVVNDSGTNRFFLQGVQKGTATSTAINISASARPTIGAWGDANADVWNGYIGAVGYWSIAWSASLRRRFEQSMGFSFKIACS